MDLVLLSDLHGKHDQMENKVPEGDVLVVAGDFTQLGLREELVSFNDWLGRQPHEHKLVVAGAHDVWCGELPANAQEVLNNCTFLMDREITIQGVRFYGTPVQPDFYEWSYDLDHAERLDGIIQRIPDSLDVLITHIPPFGINDVETGRHIGSEDLLQRVLLIHPRVHVFGHVHDGHGTFEDHGTIFVNAAICDVTHKPVRAPIKLTL